ncbi:MAG: hypothetical protein LBC92_01505, partial [Rickettsiales bacterium]|nr:hypothetical protein [Rickettsiales bacterium]
RGFYKDSFSETTNKYRKLQGNIPVNLIIEPRLFEKYEITQAPTFVFQDKKNAYKKLSGAVSINFVFEKFKEETK